MSCYNVSRYSFLSKKNKCENPSDCLNGNYMCSDCLDVAFRKILKKLLKRQFVESEHSAGVQFLLQHGVFERLKQRDDNDNIAFCATSGIAENFYDLNGLLYWPINSIDVEIADRANGRLEYQSYKDSHRTYIGPQSNGSLPYTGDNYVFTGFIWTRGL